MQLQNLGKVQGRFIFLQLAYEILVMIGQKVERPTNSMENQCSQMVLKSEKGSFKLHIQSKTLDLCSSIVCVIAKMRALNVCNVMINVKQRLNNSKTL